MATYAELANKGACGVGGVEGSNLDNGCIIDFTRIVAEWKISPSVRILPSDDITTLAYWQNLIVEGKLVPLTGIISFVEDGSDDAFETLEDDTQDLTNEGKYRFTATFKKGVYWQRVLGFLNGFQNWSSILIDSDGRIILQENVNEQGLGFTVGMNRRRKMSLPSSTASLKQMLTFQFLNRFEVDDNMKVIQRADLAFDPRQLKGVNQVKLSYVNAPSNGDTSLVVKAVLAQDNKTPIEDLESGDFLHQIGGTPANPTGETADGEEYTLTGVTPLATNNNTTLQIFDSANNRGIVNKNGNLYQSKPLLATVVV